MPKMLDAFQKISQICQKILEKTADKVILDPKTAKEVEKLRNEFEDLAKEISFKIESKIIPEHNSQNVIAYVEGSLYPDSFIVGRFTNHSSYI